ncbi:MAG: efflux RND transporter periplasmic adaptor subunit [Colwellia sp.]
MKRTIKSSVMLVFSIIVFIVVIVLLNLNKDTIEIEKSTQDLARQLVSVEKAVTQSANAKIKIFTEVKPRWQVTLTASIRGTIIHVYDNALVGEKVNKGEVLMEIESTAYIAELRAAELALKQAELELRKAKNSTIVAKKLFGSKGIPPPNDLAIHIPEQQIAKSLVISAQARVDAAKQSLRETKITAPFTGIVTGRLVSLGQSISAGEHLLQFVDNQVFELKAKVNHKQWLLLQQPITQQIAQVYSQTGERIGSAKARIASGVLDEATRQYIIYLDVENSVTNKIMVGAFVQIVMTGVTKSHTLNVPASAITQNGNIWFIDEDNRLQKFVADILYRDDDRAVVYAPKYNSDWQVAVTPLASFLPGQQVDIKLLRTN